MWFPRCQRWYLTLLASRLVVVVVMVVSRIHELPKGTPWLQRFPTAATLRTPASNRGFAGSLTEPKPCPAPGRRRRLQRSGRRPGGGGFGREGKHGRREEGDADQDPGREAQGVKRAGFRLAADGHNNDRSQVAVWVRVLCDDFLSLSLSLHLVLQRSLSPTPRISQLLLTLKVDGRARFIAM